MANVKQLTELIKSYIDTAHNTDITNLNVSGIVEPGIASEWIDNVVDQSRGLNFVNVVKHDALKYNIDINDLTSQLVQVPQGEDVTAAAKTLTNQGYSVTLESVQIVAKITDKMRAAKAWDSSFDLLDVVENQLTKAFYNQLFKLALVGRMGGSYYPETDPNNSAATAPWSTVYGWVNELKNAGNTGYFIPAKSGVPGRVAIGSDDILTVMKKMLKAHNRKWLNRFGTENKFFMSTGTGIDYSDAMADRYKSINTVKEGGLPPFRGMEVVDLPYFVDYDNQDGFIIFGNPKALLLVVNVTQMGKNIFYSNKDRVTYAVFEVYIAAGIIPEMLTIASKAYGSDSNISDDAPIILTAPTLETPKAGSTPASEVALDWNEVDGADGYKVYYKKSSDTAWTVATVTGGTNTTYTVTGLDSSKQYNITVAAYKTTDMGGYIGKESKIRSKSTAK